MLSLQEFKPTCHPPIFRFFAGIIGLIIFFITMQIVTYYQGYDFWRDAVSYFGGYADGENIIAMCFQICMYLAIITGFIYFASFFYTTSQQFSLKIGLLIVIAGGCCFAIIPYDIFNTIHAIGAGTLVFTLEVLTIIILVKSARYFHKILIWGCLVFMIFMNVFYFYAFIVDLAYARGLQKIFMISILLSFCLAFWMHTFAMCRPKNDFPYVFDSITCSEFGGSWTNSCDFSDPKFK